MRVVIDCSVLIAAGINSGTCRRVVDEVIRNHEWYISQPAWQEFLEVIERPHLQKYRHRFDELARTIPEVAVFVKPDPLPITLPDPDDVVYLQTAVVAQADVLITGDQHGFPFLRYSQTRILSPGDFLKELDEGV